MKKLMVMVDCAPHSSQVAAERLDLILMAAAFDQQLSVVFVDEGVWQLVAGQRPDDLLPHDFAAAYGSLSLYGVESLLVEHESLQGRGLQVDQLRWPVTVVHRSALQRLIAEQDCLL